MIRIELTREDFEKMLGLLPGPSINALAVQFVFTDSAEMKLLEHIGNLVDPRT